MARKRRDWRRYRPPLQYDYADTWNYVRERLLDPRKCQRGQYAVVAKHPARGVMIVACCLLRSFMKDEADKRVGCFDKRGKRVRSPVAQSVLHEVGKFKFRHPAVWKNLRRQPPGEAGIRSLVVRPERVPRVAVAGLAAALEELYGA